MVHWKATQIVWIMTQLMELVPTRNLLCTQGLTNNVLSILSIRKHNATNSWKYYRYLTRMDKRLIPQSTKLSNKCRRHNLQCASVLASLLKWILTSSRWGIPFVYKIIRRIIKWEPQPPSSNNSSVYLRLSGLWTIESPSVLWSKAIVSRLLNG